MSAVRASGPHAAAGVSRIAGTDDRAHMCRPGCITCGDAAVEAQVVRLLPYAMAVVDAGAGPEEISVALVETAAGQTVLVHAGEAIAVVQPREVPADGEPPAVVEHGGASPDRTVAAGAEAADVIADGAGR